MGAKLGRCPRHGHGPINCPLYQYVLCTNLGPPRDTSRSRSWSASFQHHFIPSPFILTLPQRPLSPTHAHPDILPAVGSTLPPARVVRVRLQTPGASRRSSMQAVPPPFIRQPYAIPRCKSLFCPIGEARATGPISPRLDCHLLYPRLFQHSARHGEKRLCTHPSFLTPRIPSCQVFLLHSSHIPFDFLRQRVLSSA